MIDEPLERDEALKALICGLELKYFSSINNCYFNYISGYYEFYHETFIN